MSASSQQEHASPFDGHVRINTVDMHTAGEPLRIIESGYPEDEQLRSGTLLDKRRYCRDKLDHYRKLLMLEPRGHLDMYGALLVEPDVPEANLAVIFIHNEGYSTMCGHAVIALARYAVDTGHVKATPPETKVTLQVPCGLVEAFVQHDPVTKAAGAARFYSVPAFVVCTDVQVEVGGYGKVTCDVSYGGAFYALVADKQLGLDVTKCSLRHLVDAADTVTKAVRMQVKLEHPDSSDLAFLYGTIVTDGQDQFSDSPTANVCVFADRQVDRSPTGSGVTARVALQHHKGLLQEGQVRHFASATMGGVFTGKVVRKVTCGSRDAVVVEVKGQAYYTSRCVFTLDDLDDKLGHGFLLR